MGWTVIVSSGFADYCRAFDIPKEEADRMNAEWQQFAKRCKKIGDELLGHRAGRPNPRERRRLPGKLAGQCVERYLTAAERLNQWNRFQPTAASVVLTRTTALAPPIWQAGRRYRITGEIHSSSIASARRLFVGARRQPSHGRL